MYNLSVKEFAKLQDEIKDKDIPIKEIVNRYAPNASEHLREILMRNFAKMRFFLK